MEQQNRHTENGWKPEPHRQKGQNETVRAITLILQFGLSVLVPIFLCLAIGIWVDSRFHSSWMLPLLILGFLAGARNAWVLAKSFQRTQTIHKKPTYDLMGEWKEGKEKTHE